MPCLQEVSHSNDIFKPVLSRGDGLIVTSVENIEQLG